MRGVRNPHGIRDCGNYFASKPLAIDALVLGRLLGYNPHTGPFCPAAPVAVGLSLRNCLRDAPEASAGYGAPGL